MIITEIGRGLGNSMYVYAAAMALAEYHKTELKLDTSHLKSWPRWEKFGGAWDFELGYFNISAKEASKEETSKFVVKTGFRPVDKIIKKYKLFERNVHYFPSNGPLEDFYKLPDNIYLWGYMGKEKFFGKIKETIKREFTLKKEYMGKIMPLIKEMQSKDSVSVHVRRGDVLKLKDANIIPIEYYEKAINLIKNKVKNPKFYVFSDEIDWCKENFSKLNIKMNFVEGYTGYETLELMKSCKHNILAVSALSWWAAYLNNNKNKIVIAPKHFTHFKYLTPDEDALPKEWIKIET